jgi:hypothetical protein
MSDRTLLVLLAIPAVIAFAFGIWAGLGYPGLYDRYASTGHAPREAPYKRLLRWFGVGHRGPPPGKRAPGHRGLRGRWRR